MDSTPNLSRRRLLFGQLSAAALATISGCAGDGSTDSAGETDAEGTGGDEPDLREANVIEVAFEGAGGTYTFDVTLHHDDEGEDGYANWWQIERLDGRRLGRRELLHAHARQPFTRSESIDVPSDVTCVVVRGHDQTHGYGGIAAVVDISSGETRIVDQGPEKRSFGTEDCP